MKRTPLKRRTPLRQGVTSLKRTRLRPVSDRRRKRDKDYGQARAEVYERAGGICEYAVGGDRCVMLMTDVHHLAGRNIPDPHALTNLLGMCRWHHDMVHANPEASYRNGHMVRRNGGAS